MLGSVSFVLTFLSIFVGMESGVRVFDASIARQVFPLTHTSDKSTFKTLLSLSHGWLASF